MAASATYNDDLARVQVAASTWGATVTHVTVTRYDNAQLTGGQVVRGGQDVPMTTGDVLALSDYEFTPGVLNTYWVRAYNASNVEVPTYSYSATVTPVLTQPWLKSIARPFLNRPVRVHDYSDVTWAARGGLFSIRGRRRPVAINEVRGAREFTLTLRADTDADVQALEDFLSFGDTVLLQVPAGSRIPGPMYARVGDVVRTKGGRHQMALRFYELPLTEVDAPDPLLVGYTGTYGGLASAFGTYAALAAALPTYLDVAEWVADPSDEVVG